jgi:hypothetical protein
MKCSKYFIPNLLSLKQNPVSFYWPFLDALSISGYTVSIASLMVNNDLPRLWNKADMP